MILIFKQVDLFTKGDGKPFNLGENFVRDINLNFLNVDVFSVLKRVSKGKNIKVRKILVWGTERDEFLVRVPTIIGIIGLYYV